MLNPNLYFRIIYLNNILFDLYYLVLKKTLTIALTEILIVSKVDFSFLEHTNTLTKIIFLEILIKQVFKKFVIGIIEIFNCMKAMLRYFFLLNKLLKFNT